MSIGLPVFNGGNYLKVAIESLLRQSHDSFELIISDNNSTDKTSEICKKYFKIDRRIRYYRQSINIGAIDNFNYVLSKAKGKYFMWAAHDDRWHKDFIKYLLRSIVETSAVLTVSNYSMYDDGKTTFVKLNNKNQFSIKESIIDFLNNISRDNSVYPYGLMKTSMIKKVGGFHKDFRPYYHSSDLVTILKILLIGKVSNIDKNLFYKRITVLYFRKFDVISKLEFNDLTTKSIQRYLFDPLYNFLDLFYSIKYTIYSDLKFIDKLIICLHFFYRFIKNIIIFAVSLIKGLFLLFRGLVKKFF